MDLLGASLCVIVFALLLHLVRLVDRTRDVLAIGRESAATMRDATLSDEEKEKAVQRGALRLFGLLFVLLLGSAACLLLPLALIWLLEFAGLFSLRGVLGMLARWDFLLGGTILGIVSYLAAAKWLKTSS